MKARRMIQAVSTYSNSGSRPTQEDHVLSLQEKGIFAVADGFGGAVSGANAAKTACDALQSFLVKEAGDLEATLPFVLRQYFSLAGNVLFNALVHANKKVVSLNKGKNVHEKGGTSMIAAFLDGDLLAVANVGCCSAWLFREGKSAELVIPRTYGRLLDPFSARNVDPNTQVPLMAMGLSDDLEPEICEYRVRPGDWLLLGSDGVGPDVHQELLAIHCGRKSGIEAGNAAVSLMKSRVFEDNASISLVIF